MSLEPTASAIHLNLPPTTSSQSRHPTWINIHPSVIASILTHHTRRPEDAAAPRVIGALMGARSQNAQEIEVRTSFAVPHSENEGQQGLDMPFHQAMLDLLSKIGTKEQIVGWYATSPDLNAYSALVQNYFNNETGPLPAVHLTIDTSLNVSGQGLGMKGWMSTQLGLNPKEGHCVFLPVPVQLKYAESERAALDLLTAQSTPNPSLPPLPTLSSSLSELSALIDDCLSYVQDVNSGAKQGDVEVGRYLLEGLGRWSGSEGETGGVKEGLQDTLTVSYLANLVRSQAELSGRLALLPQNA